MTETTDFATKPSMISVILSTYNAPCWLEKSLWGYAEQTFREFEVVIADDGSGPATSDLINRLRAELGVAVKHVWHEDDGFRKCRILNRAIEASEGDYIVCSDGDCVPRSDFLQHHYEGAQRGCFLSGGYFKLPISTSERISRDEIRDGSAFTFSWLRANGWKPSHRALRLVRWGHLATLLNRLTTTGATWNGHNASGWKDDLVGAGGFDERMRYGGEDRELGERLENAGIRGKHVRYQTLCLHLDHARGYVNQADLDRNRQIREMTSRLRRTRTEHGISRAA